MPSSATIDAFAVPAVVNCTAGTPALVPATYKTTGATTVAFLVDSVQAPGAAPTNGTFNVPVPCDGTVHTVVLAAVDANGRTAIQTKAVRTESTPS